MRKPIENAGFRAPSGRPLGHERRAVAVAELVAIVVLALCTVVSVTVLTVGIARANVVDGVIDHEGSLFGLALLLGLAFIGMGGFALLPGRKAK